MHRWVRGLLFVGGMTIAALGAGCEAPGVGDPCTPEQIPMGGFNPAEAYLETSSVQCRTRVCMVYKLAGDPSKIIGTPSCTPADMTAGVCVAPERAEQKVYCSCRCRAPEGVDATVCECPDDFTCVDVLELGGDGIRGGYCVRKSDPDSAAM